MMKRPLLNIIAAVFFASAPSCSPGGFVDNNPGGAIGAEDTLYVDSEGFLRNGKGQEFLLRGVNFGGWMLQESWMCPVSGADKTWANLDTIRAMESRSFSTVQIQELFDTYEDNWITAEDFDLLKNRGVNSLRLPFWYRNFMQDEAGSWINDNGSAVNTKNPGFKRLDWAVEQAKKRGIYVILDLHGAPGGQSTDHSTGTCGKNELFTNPTYEEATVFLWKALALRYKNEPAVAAYDLLNEPQNNDGPTANAWAPGSARAVHETIRLYDRLYREIRSVDPETIIIMEAVWDMNNLPDPGYVSSGSMDAGFRFSGKTSTWDKNLVYSMHLYDRDKNGIDRRINELTRARKNWGVAVHIGEFNNGDENQEYAYRQYNENHINWNMWTYKLAGADMGNWSLYQSASASKADPGLDSFETIMQKWGPGLNTSGGFSKTAMNGINLNGQKQTVDGVYTKTLGRASFVPTRLNAR